jgi:uncharacterized Zn finger protein (UPF0148 family)
MSWDVPTGDKCPECQSPLVSTAKGGVKCSNKDCSYKIKSEKDEKPKTKKAKVEMQDDFTPPPLMDEPQYFDFAEGDAE